MANRAAVYAEWQDLQGRFPELRGWTLVINGRMRSVFGRCMYRKNQIHVARWHVERGKREDVINTLRHEAAHALTPGAGHGPLWKAMCRIVGAKPERCGSVEAWKHSPAAQAAPKWRVTCLRCGNVMRRRRRAGDWHTLVHQCKDGRKGQLHWVDTATGRGYTGVAPIERKPMGWTTTADGRLALSFGI